MNSVRHTFFVLISFLLFSCNGNQTVKKTTIPQKSNQVEVLDFYGKHRCTACISIEEKTKLTLETYFANEIKNGLVSFSLINISEEENETITEKFGAYGTSLFLNVIKDGKETPIDLTNFAFKEEQNKEVFMQELKVKIENELKKL